MVLTACYNNLYGNIFILDPDDVCNNNNMQDNGEAGIDCGGGGFSSVGDAFIDSRFIIWPAEVVD